MITFKYNVKLGGEYTFEYYVRFFVGQDDIYGVVGNGWCRAQCNDGSFSCGLNGYRKEPSDANDCKSACNSEPACTGFAISDTSYDDPNRCFVYGDVTEFSHNLTNSNDWIEYLNYPEEIKNTFKIQSSTGGSENVRCFKRIMRYYQPTGKCLIVCSQSINELRK